MINKPLQMMQGKNPQLKEPKEMKSSLKETEEQHCPLAAASGTAGLGYFICLFIYLFIEDVDL